MAEVRTDERESNEVTLHGRLLTALAKHLLKDARIETVKQTREKTVRTLKRREEQRREDKRREKPRTEKRLTRVWTPQRYPAEVLPNCPPSWCETELSSSPLLSRGIPLLEEGPCSHLCRPKTEDQYT